MLATTPTEQSGVLPDFVTDHSSELVILMLFTILVITLIILVPQLLRAHIRRQEMVHQEHMTSLDKEIPICPSDERSRMAARMALLVPMVVLITAGTVTCFLAAYRSEYLFTVSLSVWVVGGVVSLAAITGGVALIGRLAQLQSGDEEEEDLENPLSS
jgi:hypothetical protein